MASSTASATSTSEANRDREETTTMTYEDRRRADYLSESSIDYEGRLQDSFFQYVAREKDYDQNEVPWAESGKPVQVQMSAYLRKVPG